MIGYVITITAFFLLGCLVSYLLGRLRGELLITKYKVSRNRTYDILSELRKQYVACLQRETPYKMHVVFDSNPQQINPNFQKIFSKKPMSYNRQGGRKK